MRLNIKLVFVIISIIWERKESMAKINIVLEGKFKNEKVYGSTFSNGFKISTWSVNKNNVSSYTVIDETNKDQYSIWKGALGVALLGCFGAVAGVGGKKKKEYLIAIEWKDGEKSLICIDDEYYKVLVKSMF